jgi:hypothetical protein
MVAKNGFNTQWGLVSSDGTRAGAGFASLSPGESAPPLVDEEGRLWTVPLEEPDMLLQAQQFYAAALPAGIGATVDVPGPGAGLVRVFDGIQVLADVLAAPLAAVTGDIIAPGPTAYRVASGLTGAFAGNMLCYVLGEGEVFRVTNGSVNAGRVRATYRDVSAANVGLIRLGFGAAGAVLIPAPPAGFYRRLMQAWVMTSVNRTLSALINAYNTDSIAQTVEALRGGDLFWRGQSTGSLAVGAFQPLDQVPVTAVSGDMTVRTVAAIATANYVLTGANETLELL